MTFCAIDPGKKTGLVLSTEESTANNIDILYADEFTWEQRFTMYDVILNMSVTELIVEDFMVFYNPDNPLAGYRVYSSEIIGVLEYLAKQNNINFTLQQPSIKKRVKIDKEYKSLLKGSEHKKDAFQHLRYWLVKNGKY